MTGFLTNIEEATQKNINFRQVIYTGQHAQIVLMHLNPGEEIGMEVHTVTDQFIRVESGEGKVIMNDEESSIKDGSAFLIPAGTNHNVVNTSADKPMKLYTIYSPPHHRDGVVHKTKSDAEADRTDFL